MGQNEIIDKKKEIVERSKKKIDFANKGFEYFI